CHAAGRTRPSPLPAMQQNPRACLRYACRRAAAPFRPARAGPTGVSMKPSTLSSRLFGLVLGLSAGMALVAPAAVHAQAGADWPTKPLRFVVPYPPGGPLDLMA